MPYEDVVRITDYSFKMYSMYQHKSRRFYKWQDWSKCISIVDIPTPILLTIFLFIDHSLKYKLKVYIITHAIEKISSRDWYVSQNW